MLRGAAVENSFVDNLRAIGRPLRIANLTFSNGHDGSVRVPHLQSDRVAIAARDVADSACLQPLRGQFRFIRSRPLLPLSGLYIDGDAVSYTHLTLPTIYPV